MTELRRVRIPLDDDACRVRIPLDDDAYMDTTIAADASPETLAALTALGHAVIERMGIYSVPREHPFHSRRVATVRPRSAR